MAEVTAELINLANGCAAAGDTLAAKICRDAIAEVARLQAIVDKLPKTADGVVVLPGMTLYEHCWMEPFHVRELVAVSDDVKRSEWMCDDGEIDPLQCYSTREAAEAAERE